MDLRRRQTREQNERSDNGMPICISAESLNSTVDRSGSSRISLRTSFVNSDSRRPLHCRGFIMAISYCAIIGVSIYNSSWVLVRYLFGTCSVLVGYSGYVVQISRFVFDLKM